MYSICLHDQSFCSEKVSQVESWEDSDETSTKLCRVNYRTGVMYSSPGNVKASHVRWKRLRIGSGETTE